MGQRRGTCQVVRIEAILLEALRTNGGACQGGVDVVPCSVDGDALHALAKVRVGRVCVGHEATDVVRVRLVLEEPHM